MNEEIGYRYTYHSILLHCQLLLEVVILSYYLYIKNMYIISFGCIIYTYCKLILKSPSGRINKKVLYCIVLATNTSLMVLDSPWKRDSGGIHLTGSRAFGKEKKKSVVRWISKRKRKRKMWRIAFFLLDWFQNFFSSLTQLQATTITQRRLNATCDERT